MFNEFFFQIEDYLVYCRTKGLSTKTIKSYEQSLRMFAKYCEDKYGIYLLYWGDKLWNVYIFFW